MEERSIVEVSHVIKPVKIDYTNGKKFSGKY